MREASIWHTTLKALTSIHEESRDQVPLSQFVPVRKVSGGAEGELASFSPGKAEKNRDKWSKLLISGV